MAELENENDNSRELTLLRNRVSRLELLIALITGGPEFAKSDIGQLIRQQVFGDNAFYPRRTNQAVDFAPSGYDDTPFRRFYDDILKQLAENSHSIASLESEYRSLQDSSITYRRNTLWDVQRWMAVQSLGLDQDALQLPRFVGIRVFTSSSSELRIRELDASVRELLTAFDLVLVNDLAEVRGSWLKEFIAKTRKIATNDEVQERLKKLERAIELQALGKVQADIDDRQATAVERLLKSAENSDNIVLHVGSVFLAKTTDTNGQTNVVVKTLTQNEMILIESNPNLVSSPLELLKKLSELSHTKSTATQGSISISEQRPKKKDSSIDESHEKSRRLPPPSRI